MVSFRGSSTAITRGASWLRSFRIQKSSLSLSTRLLAFEMPIIAAKSRMAEGLDATAAQPCDRRHAWVVPPTDVAILYEEPELTLAHQCVAKTQSANSYWRG